MDVTKDTPALLGVEWFFPPCCTPPSGCSQLHGGLCNPWVLPRIVVERVLLWEGQSPGAAPHLCPRGTACCCFGVQSMPVVFSHEPGNGTFLSPLPAHWPFVSGFELKCAWKVQISSKILKDSSEIRHRIPVAVEWDSGSESFKLF